MSINKLRNLRNRLDAWQEELQTNKNKMAEFAPRAIKLLKQQIKDLENIKSKVLTPQDDPKTS